MDPVAITGTSFPSPRSAEVQGWLTRTLSAPGESKTYLPVT